MMSLPGAKVGLLYSQVSGISPVTAFKSAVMLLSCSRVNGAPCSSICFLTSVKNKNSCSPFKTSCYNLLALVIAYGFQPNHFFLNFSWGHSTISAFSTSCFPTSMAAVLIFIAISPKLVVRNTFSTTRYTKVP